MDIEFHYYMTHLIALRAGFQPDDAFTIAYASQYTDDNDTVFKIEGGEEPYENLISQTINILKPQEERLGIYPIFHFCPGTKTEMFRLSPPRRDGKYHRLNTIADSRSAKKLFDDAMKSKNLYRIGVSTHMYADTFCHRDFAGWKDEFNEIGHLPEVFAIGHAHAGAQPDLPTLIWEDPRLTSIYREKRNKVQILAAAANIFDFFCKNTKPTNAEVIKSELMGDLDLAIGPEVESLADAEAGKDGRSENYKNLLGGEYRKYNDSQWFDEAINRRSDPLTIGTPDVKYTYTWKGDYHNSDWFAFQEAVKTHRAAAFKVLDQTFKDMEVDIAGV